MAQQFINDIGGFTPLVDARKVDKPYVISGKNFMFNADGVHSAFGRKVKSYKAIKTLGNIQTFKVSETQESFIANDEGIFRFDTQTGECVPAYINFNLINSEYPWSMAAVGNKYYFARKGANLIEYDIVNNDWKFLVGGSIPSNPYAVTESDGRLILLSDLFVSWSAIGDGTDFTPSSTTGAGSQALTKLGLSNPIPLGIKTVADGFVTFLSSGIMKSQSIESIVTYRHTILSKVHRVINPYCITNTENDDVVFLTQNGLYTTAGQKPELYEPIISEYLHANYLPNIDYTNNQNSIQLDYDYARSWFSIWLAESEQDYTYTKAFILNTKVGKWGVLEATFSCLANFYTIEDVTKGFIYGIVDNEGSVSIFDSTQGVAKIDVSKPGYTYRRVREDFTARSLNGTVMFAVNGNSDTENRSNFTATGLYYDWTYLFTDISPLNRSVNERPPGYNNGVDALRVELNSGAGLAILAQTKVDQQISSLDSEITIAPLRMFDQEFSDTLSYVTAFTVGTLGTAVGDIIDDWNSQSKYPVDVIFDANVENGELDAGAGASAGVDYTVELYPTLDNANMFSNSKPEIYAVNSEYENDFYAVYSTGLYHLINFKADYIGANYMVKTLDYTVYQGGRL